jgi:NADH:ubiquinone oxidoreductase subunit K
LNQLGQAFAVFVITVVAAEAAVGVALFISIHRQRNTVDVEALDEMKDRTHCSANRATR